MTIHLLLTEEIRPTMPETINVVADYGELKVVLPYENSKSNIIDFKRGSHVLLNGEENMFSDWLRPFDGILVGVGSPMMQQFEIMHVKK